MRLDSLQQEILQHLTRHKTSARIGEILKRHQVENAGALASANLRIMEEIARFDFDRLHKSIGTLSPVQQEGSKVTGLAEMFGAKVFLEFQLQSDEAVESPNQPVVILQTVDTSGKKTVLDYSFSNPVWKQAIQAALEELLEKNTLHCACNIEP